MERQKYHLNQAIRSHRNFKHKSLNKDRAELLLKSKQTDHNAWSGRNYCLQANRQIIMPGLGGNYCLPANRLIIMPGLGGITAYKQTDRSSCLVWAELLLTSKQTDHHAWSGRNYCLQANRLIIMPGLGGITAYKQTDRSSCLVWAELLLTSNRLIIMPGLGGITAYKLTNWSFVYSSWVKSMSKTNVINSHTNLYQMLMK